MSSLDEDERDLRDLVKRMDTPTEKMEEHPIKDRRLREMKSSSDESLLESAPSARRRRNLTTAGRHAGLRSQMDLKGESEKEGGQKEKECIV